MAKKVSDPKDEIKKAVATEKTKRVAKKALVTDPLEEKKKEEAKRVKTSAAEAIKSDLFSEEVKQKYYDLQTEIGNLETQLKDLYGIDAKALELADLINAYNVKESELDEQAKMNAAEREASAKSQIADLTAAIQAKKDELEKTKKSLDAEEKQYRADLKTAREREEAEFMYNQTRVRSKENDAWADEKADREKKLQERELAVSAREEEVTKREAKMSDLEKQVAEIPSLVENATKSGKEEGKKEAEKNNAFETRYLKKEHENAVSLLQAEVKNQEKQITTLTEQVASLQAKLDAAYVRNQELATTVAKNSGTTKIVTEAPAGK